MVLVDTSAWIDFFNDVSPVADKVEQLVNNGEVALCPIVWTEILQGVRDDKVLAEMKNFLADFQMLDDNMMDIAEKSVSIYRTLRKVGTTIRKTNDCMIAAYSMLNNIPILQKDRDFDAIAEKLPLELYK